VSWGDAHYDARAVIAAMRVPPLTMLLIEP
jgi:hypothetical protein